MHQEELRCIADDAYGVDMDAMRVQGRGVLVPGVLALALFWMGLAVWSWAWSPLPSANSRALGAGEPNRVGVRADPASIAWAASINEEANFSGDAVPLGPARPGDWLYHFPEAGQTLAQFRAGMPRRRDHRRYVIYVAQMGAMRPRGDRIVDVVAEYLDAYYDSPAVVLPPVAVPAAAWDSERRQYDARAVLQALQRALPDDALGLVAVTEVDLFIPAVNYVFGLASFERQVSVVSLRRFGNDFRPGAAPGTVLRRALTVSAHEFGHILSMRHCTAFRCLMNGTNSLEDADRHSQHLCPQCVRKAHHALGFYRNDRYARLKYFYEKYGLAGEEEFVARRLDPPKVELVAAE